MKNIEILKSLQERGYVEVRGNQIFPHSRQAAEVLAKMSADEKKQFLGEK